MHHPLSLIRFLTSFRTRRRARKTQLYLAELDPHRQRDLGVTPFGAPFDRE